MARPTSRPIAAPSTVPPAALPVTVNAATAPSAMHATTTRSSISITSPMVRDRTARGKGRTSRAHAARGGCDVGPCPADVTGCSLVDVGDLEERQPIVVGVDGSPTADAAARWAVGQAALVGSAVRVVHAWQYPYAGDLSALSDKGAPTAFEAAAKGVLDALVARVRAGCDGDGVEIVAELRHGDPASVLLEAGKGAQLLVVGTRGLGPVRGALLGSVAQRCLAGAPCPVVVVPTATAVSARRRRARSAAR